MYYSVVRHPAMYYPLFSIDKVPQTGSYIRSWESPRLNQHTAFLMVVEAMLKGVPWNNPHIKNLVYNYGLQDGTVIALSKNYLSDKFIFSSDVSGMYLVKGPVFRNPDVADAINALVTNITGTRDRFKELDTLLNTDNFSYFDLVELFNPIDSKVIVDRWKPFLTDFKML